MVTGVVVVNLNGDGVTGLGGTHLGGVMLSRVGVRLRDEAGETVASTTTDADGSYSFDDLAAGTYQVEFVPPEGYRFIRPRHDADADGSAADPTTGWTAPFTLTGGEHLDHLNAGLFRPASVSGVAWTDANGDGVWDEGEAVTSGVRIELRGANGSPVGWTTTGDGGGYQFADLDPGQYTVSVVTPWHLTSADQGADYSFDLRTGTAHLSLLSGETFDGLRVALGPNAKPDGETDSYSVTPGGSLTVGAAGGVLGNDTDPDGDPLTATLVRGVESGTLSLAADGGFTYAPVPGFTGRVTFAYQPADPTGPGEPVLVTIRVGRGPVPGDDAVATPSGTPITVDVLANDTDIDGYPLSVSAVSQGLHGSVTINPDRTVTYTPAAGFTGYDSFSYTADDGRGGTATATARVLVGGTAGAAPAVVGQSVIALQGTLPVIRLEGSDPNSPALPLSYLVVSGPSHGSLSGSGPDLVYTPDAGYVGPDWFLVIASNGILTSDPATVWIDVVAPPVLAGQLLTTTAGTDCSITLGGSDPNGLDFAVDYLVVVAPSHGTLSGSGPDLVYTPDAGYVGPDSFQIAATNGLLTSDPVRVTVVVLGAPSAGDDEASTAEDSGVTVPVLWNDSDPNGGTISVVAVTQGAHGTVTFTSTGVTYTPDANYNGTDSFTYTVDNGLGGSATATVAVTVAPVNDPPVAADDSDNTLEDTPVSGDLLANDTDIDGDALTVSLVNGPAHGSLALNPDGTFTYAPDADSNGTDSFTYQADDGHGGYATAVVRITIAPVNDAPVTNPDAALTNEDAGVTIDVLANDTDPDGDALTVTTVTAPVHGTAAINTDGTVTYTPAAGFYGIDAFTYTVSDGHGGTNTASVTVTVNAPPAGTDESYVFHATALVADSQVGVLANDTDPDGGTLTAVLVSGSAHGTLALEPDGSFTYTPVANWSGADSFSYRPFDGAAYGDPVTVSLDLTNAPPTAYDIVTSTRAGARAYALVSGYDPEGDPLTLVAVTQGAHGAVQTYSDAGYLAYTPDSGFAGSDAFTYTLADGFGGEATGNVAMTVTSVTGTVSGRVWDDGMQYPDLTVDGDGLQTAGRADAGYSGVTVHLLNAAGAEVASATTDQDGYYTFALVVVGQYRVKFDPPAGDEHNWYVFSPPSQGSDPTLDSDADSSGYTAVFTLGENAVIDRDAGLIHVTDIQP